MLLTVDVGNTNVVLGVFENRKMIGSWRMATDNKRSADEYGVIIDQMFRHDGISPKDIDDAIISTVVPSLLFTLQHMCLKYFNITPLVVETGIKTGLKIKCDDPRQIGSDRIVNAVAAHAKYDGPLIVVDFGTATTFCVVTEDAEFLGGAIAPGIKTSATALFEHTAKLPNVDLETPNRVICKNTIENMQAGLIFGQMGLAERIIEGMKKELVSDYGKKYEDIKVIATWRQPEWTMQSREDEIAFCKAHGIDLPFDAKHSYSRDRNIWHISHEGLELENPANEPNYDDLLVLSVTPEKAPDEPEYIDLDFEKGYPVALNGKKMKTSDIIRELNKLGGKHGIGIIDIVENRVVGMKSRGVYETPGGTILTEAHKQLEELTLDRDTMEYKKLVGTKFAALVYEGKWFCTLRESLSAFVAKTEERVTGHVKMKLYKGNIIKAGTTSDYTLYSESLASFTTGDLYDHKDASGFINLFGLSMKVRAMMDQKREEKDNANNK